MLVALFPGEVDGVVFAGVVDDGVLIDVDDEEGVLDEEPDDGAVVDAPDVDPVFSAGVVVDVVVEVVPVVPLPEDGVAGPLDDVELAAHPETNRVRTMV